MYVCICICIHVNVCHVYIMCHLQKLAAAAKLRSLPLDHPSQLGPPLDIPSLSGSHVRQPCFPPRIVRHQTEESVKTEGSLGENRFFGGKKIVTSKRRELNFTPPGGSLWEGKGNGNYRNATNPVTIPGSIPGNYGKSHPWLKLRSTSSAEKNFPDEITWIT